MGATIGLSFFVFVVQPIFSLTAPTVNVSISAIFFMQQSMIMVTLTFTEKMYQLYGKCLSKE